MGITSNRNFGSGAPSLLEKITPRNPQFWSSRIEKYDFEPISDEKFFFALLFREDSEGPQVSEISTSNKSGKIGLHKMLVQK